MIKKYLGLLSFLFIFIACNDDDNNDVPNPTPDSDSITILAYLVANNNLDGFLKENIATMYDGLADMKEPATLLIYWDGRSKIGESENTHLILKYQTNGKGKINGNKALNTSYTLNEVLAEAEIVKEYPSQMSTDGNVMSNVLKDMAALSPTDKMGLIFGSHGSSWLNTIFTGSRSFGQDGSGSDNTILLTDMVQAISSVGKTFEFILFDACYMGSAEVCYDFRNVTKYQIVSAMEIPAYGFPYSTLLKYLYQGTTNGYKQACQEYIDYYQYILEEETGNAWGTVALVDSKEMQSLTNEIKEEIVKHKIDLADYNPNVLQEYGRGGGPYISYDLEHFIKDMNNHVIPESFKVQINKTVLYKGCLETARTSSYEDYSVDVTNYCGLGIYIPTDKRPKWNQYFKTIDWYTASGWNEVTFSWNF